MDEFLTFIVGGILLIIFLSVIVGVIALGVAIGFHLIEPIGDLLDWIGRQVPDLLRRVLNVLRATA